MDEMVVLLHHKTFLNHEALAQMLTSFWTFLGILFAFEVTGCFDHKLNNILPYLGKVVYVSDTRTCDLNLNGIISLKQFLFNLL